MKFGSKKMEAWRTSVLSVLALFLVVSLSQCTWRADEFNYIDIDPSKLPGPTIEFFGSEDTLYLRSSAVIDIGVSSSTEIWGYELYIGGQLAVDGTQYPSTVRVNSTEFADGIYRMTLRVFAKSNSGSLADQLGSEAVVTEFSKTCIIDNRAVRTSVRGFIAEEGVLKLKWNTYEDYHFEHYELEFSPPFQSYSQTITDPTVNEISIPDFIGGQIRGSFNLSAKNEEATSRLDFWDDLDFNIELVNDQFLVSVSASPYAATESMHLIHDNGLKLGEELITTYALEKRAYEREAIDIARSFPMDLIFKLEASSNTLNNHYIFSLNINSQQSQFPLEYDESLNLYVKDDFIAHYIPSSNTSKFIQYDRQTGSISKQLTGKVGLSPNGKWLYELRDSVLISYDPVTLQSRSAFVLTDYLQIEGELRRIFVTNANQVLFYSFISYNHYNTTLTCKSYLFDIDDPKNIVTRDHSSNTVRNWNYLLDVNGQLTSSGNYFFNLPPKVDARAPFFTPYVITSKNELFGEEGKQGILLSSDYYLVGDGQKLVKRDYALHSIQLEKTLDGEIVEVLSNYEDLCAVVLLKPAGDYEIVVVNTDSLDVLARMDLNSSSIGFQKRFINNNLFIVGQFDQIYAWDVNE